MVRVISTGRNDKLLYMPEKGRKVTTALDAKQKSEAALKILTALLANPNVVTIALADESPAETARKIRRCVQLSWDTVRDLNRELLFQLHGVGKGLEAGDVSDVARRGQ